MAQIVHTKVFPMASDLNDSAAHRFRWVTWIFENTVRLTVFGFFSILLGVTLYFAKQHIDKLIYPKIYFTFDFFYSGFKELGFALLIAVAISEGIERVARAHQNAEFQEQLRRTKENVLEAVYGEKDIYFRHFRSHVVERSFLRRGMKVSLRFLPHAARGKHGERIIRIHVDTRFEIENVTDVPVDYPLMLSIEKPWDSTFEDQIRAVHIEIDREKLNPATIHKADQKGEDTQDFVILSKDVEIAARSARNFHVEVNIYKYEQDHFVWQSLIPADGLSYSVEYGPDFELYSGEMIADDKVVVDESTQGLPGMLAKRIPDPLFPGNGFVIWWRKRPVAEPAVPVEGSTGGVAQEGAKDGLSPQQQRENAEPSAKIAVPPRL